MKKTMDKDKYIDTNYDPDLAMNHDPEPDMEQNSSSDMDADQDMYADTDQDTDPDMDADIDSVPDADADFDPDADLNARPGKRKGSVMITLGLLTIAASLCLVLYNYWDGQRAAKASKAIVDQIDSMLPEERTDPDEPTIEEAPTREEELKKKEIPPMPTVEIDGYLYIGELDIPKLGLHLPVMADWDMERLKISPCHYSGSYYSDDLVILAHNYARHFSPIKWLGIGEDVIFTNVEGVVYRYKVSNRVTIEPERITQMIWNKNNTNNNKDAEDWDLTLFTCNTGGATRCAVRCDRVKDEVETEEG